MRRPRPPASALRRLGGVLAIALPLGGCVVAPAYPTYPYGYGAAPAPVSSNTATGAVVGAAAGGLLGAAAGGPYNRGGAALGGAAAGALVGGLLGAAVDQQNAQAAQGYGYGYGYAPAPEPYAYPPPPEPAYGYATPYAAEPYRY
ncbi:MAG: hypothetical protein K2X74_15540 [Acetobacteraceae bacterium]|nr:hypothetical protein [Acetobacteraceae bacterium]